MGRADHRPRIKKEKNLSQPTVRLLHPPSSLERLFHLHLLFFLTKEKEPIEQHHHHGQRRPYLLHIYSLRSHHCIADMHYYGGIGLHKLRFRYPQRPLLLQGMFEPSESLPGSSLMITGQSSKLHHFVKCQIRSILHRQ